MFKNALLAMVLGAIGLFASLDQASAQLSPPPGGIKRTVLQKVDVPGSTYEVVLVLAEIPAMAALGRHSHPGTETATVTEGELTLKVDGQPDKVVKAGESWQVAAGAIHDATTGDKPCKAIVAYAVEKGKPLASPAAAK